MMNYSQFPPSLILILGGCCLLFMGRYLFKVALLALPALCLWQVWHVKVDAGVIPFLGYELTTLYIHPFTLIFATAFAVAALGGGLFALHTQNRKEMAAAFVYAGSAIGVTFSGDLITLFIYWEIMALASTLLIWSHGTKAAREAGMRYALMHVFGGVLLMAGIAAYVSVAELTLLPHFHLHENGLWMSAFPVSDTSTASIGIWLIFIAILVNTAAPPFSSWLSDAYPESSPTGMVFLSAFTTKAAVFVLLTLFADAEILIPVGLGMAGYGIVMALLENDMRRMLAFSLIVQVGFMCVGIGIGTPLALQGTAMLAFCHILYKALLVMATGSVMEMTGKRKCTELGGLYRHMKITCLCCMVGAFAISGFPLTIGFLGKSMLSSAAGYEKWEWVWYGLLSASAAAFVYIGLRLPWFVFFGKSSGLTPKDPPASMRIAMLAFAALCIIPAFFPQHMMGLLLPEVVEYGVYTPEHVFNQLQLTLASTIAFFLCLPLLQPKPTVTLGFDWIYRRFMKATLIILEKGMNAGYTTFICAMHHSVRLLIFRIARLTGPGGIFAETKTLANTTLIVAILLAGYLLLYYTT